MKKTKEGYHKNKHSLFLLQYHLVLVTKYRKPVLIKEIDKFIKDYAVRYLNNNGGVVLKFESNFNYIYIFLEASTNTNLINLINGLKIALSRIVRPEFKSELSKHYCKPYFWSRSYFIVTVSERNTQIVREYIKNQEA